MADRPAALVTDGGRAAMAALGWLVVAGGAAALLLQLVEQPNRPVAAVQAMTPWALLPLVAVACTATWTGRSGLGFASALAGLGVVALALPLVLAGRGPAPADGRRMTVLSVNVLSSNTRVDEIGDEVERVAPDVVAFAEVTEDILDVLHAHPVARRFPHRIEAPDDLASGVVLWSRYPAQRRDTVPGLRRAIQATIDGPIGPTHVVAAHPPPPVFDPDVWSQQIGLLPDVASSSALPTVVMGDLNASWFHPAFRRAVARAGLRDAAAADGRGLTMTWPTDTLLPPFVTLDHVLVDDRIAVVATATRSMPGSDHRAVLTTLAAAARSG